MPAARSTAEQQTQRTKLTNSYHELLEEFSSKELRTVGNYNLGRLVGKGSFGKVYLASHKLTNGSKVVLKSAKKDDSNLAREIHHHRQFLHPHIARLYEIIVTENLVWLVLEYCPGDELFNYLLRHGSLPTEKVQKIFTQLVGAVAYVHNMSCVHRDLKLENILLDKNENVKLCDFGFTREYEGKASYLQTFCGTVCYSAPEMLKGEKYAGEKVDVWSLGIILFALLSGELPFDEDDDLTTKHKILSVEPSYSEALPADAKALISQLLSKRPLHRPTLAEILTNPFLAEHAPQQQATLKLTQPAPFTTGLEKETLERMRSAGVDIDKVIENVLAQRCDSLAGWWALLIEKEGRKERRRELKRKEKEAETKSLRRISTASGRLVLPLKEVAEEKHASSTLDPPRARGRRDRRSIPSPQIVISDLPQLPENSAVDSPGSSTPPPPIEKDPIRSGSSSDHRPALPPKETRQSQRGSALHTVTANPDLLAPPNGITKRRAGRKPIMNHLISIKHWFIDTTKRARSPGTRSNSSTVKLPQEHSPVTARRSPTNKDIRTTLDLDITPKQQQRQYQHSSTPTPRPRTRTPSHRSSLSPAPLTPRSSNRRSSAGLRSTSSSVSSIRSVHHIHTHSKASSISSNSASIKTSARSPHTSVKVLPATPTISSFPSNIRLVRVAPTPISTFNERAYFSNMSGVGGASTSPGLVYAKRKKTLFRGPMLNVASLSMDNGGSAIGGRRDGNSSTGSRSTSVAGRTSGETIEEEDEEVEEVEVFSPVGGEAEETIWEAGEVPMRGYRHVS